MSWVLTSVALVAAAYQLLALFAALRHLRITERPPRDLPPISILKPVKGVDPNFYEAIRSHAEQEYPEFEIVFGVGDAADPAAHEIRRLIQEFPERRIRLATTISRAPNGKVGVLIGLAAEARHPLLLVNDGDIRVPSDYLRRIVAPLEDAATGLVTCLYEPVANGWPGRWEAIGVATDFVPGVLTAPYAGVREFGLGSTLLFRAEDLRAIGGFESLKDYIADDYQLAARLAGLGRKVALSKVVVQTYLSARTWADVWRHQLRWARTIRVSRPGGYLGLPATQASLWSAVALAAGLWWLAVPLLTLRLCAGLLAGWGVVRSRDAARYFFLIPFRDLWGFAVWLWGLFGRWVEWRGLRLRLNREGKIVEVSQAETSFNG